MPNPAFLKDHAGGLSSVKTGMRIRKIIFSVLAICIVVCSLLIFGTDYYDTPTRFDLVQLDDGWTVSRGGSTWKLPSVIRSNIGITDKDETITLTRTLPNSRINPATIYYRTVLSSTRVYVDGDLIYSFGDEYVSSGRMLPKMENFVQLPNDFSGREITIEITAHENNAFSGLSPIMFGNYNDIKNNLIQSKRLNFVIGVYLCHLGFLLLIIAPFLAFSRNHDFSIFFSAVNSVMVGVYLLCYNDIFWYISDNPEFYTFIEYFSLFMVPAAIVGFVLTSGKSRYKVFGIALFVINLVFAASTSLLHILNVIHICLFVSWFHVICICEGIFIIVTVIMQAVRNSIEDNNYEYKKASTNLLVGGLVFFLCCSVIDIIKFNIMKYSKTGDINTHISFMTIGGLVFITTLLLNYFYHCIEYFSESSVKEQLEGLAYTDSLTSISNRARCEQVLAELTGGFTIISLDLDYLKYTNDNMGHDQGDKLISGFAEILADSFTDASLTGRMGGDEFIVVLPYVDDERTDRSIAGFSDQLAYRNSTEPRLRFSASWGYASSTEKELKGNNSAQNVYLLADKRMYAMKNKHHKESLGRLYDDLLKKVRTEGGKS